MHGGVGRVVENLMNAGMNGYDQRVCELDPGRFTRARRIQEDGCRKKGGTRIASGVCSAPALRIQELGLCDPGQRYPLHCHDSWNGAGKGDLQHKGCDRGLPVIEACFDGCSCFEALQRNG